MMKRLLVLCAVLVPLFLFVAGCGATGGGSSSSKSMPSQEEQKKMQEEAQKNMAKMMKTGQPGGGTPGAPAAK